MTLFARRKRGYHKPPHCGSALSPERRYLTSAAAARIKTMITSNQASPTPHGGESRYRTIGIKLCHGPKLRSRLPTSQRFLAGKLDGKRNRPEFAFPVLNCAATQSEHFPCRNLIDC